MNRALFDVQAKIQAEGDAILSCNKAHLVLRLRQDARGRHKLTPPWEGPFVVAKVLKPGTYKLANSQGEVYSNAWNIRQLRRFYP